MVDHVEMRNAYMRALNQRVISEDVVNVKFKKSYIGKISKKIFEAKSKFIVFYVLGKLRKRFVRIKIKSQSGDKFITVKLPRDEYQLILLAALSSNQSLEDFITQSIREYVDSRYEVQMD
jgi:hypothetical protein